MQLVGIWVKKFSNTTQTNFRHRIAIRIVSVFLNHFTYSVVIYFICNETLKNLLFVATTFALFSFTFHASRVSSRHLNEIWRNIRDTVAVGEAPTLIILVPLLFGGGAFLSVGVHKIFMDSRERSPLNISVLRARIKACCLGSCSGKSAEKWVNEKFRVERIKLNYLPSCNV